MAFLTIKDKDELLARAVKEGEIKIFLEYDPKVFDLFTVSFRELNSGLRGEGCDVAFTQIKPLFDLIEELAPLVDGFDPKPLEHFGPYEDIELLAGAKLDTLAFSQKKGRENSQLTRFVLTVYVPETKSDWIYTVNSLIELFSLYIYIKNLCSTKTGEV